MDTVVPEERRMLEAELPRYIRVCTYDELAEQADRRRLIMTAYSLPCAFNVAPHHPWPAAVQHAVTDREDLTRNTYLGGPPGRISSPP